MISQYKRLAELSGGAWLIACGISVAIAAWQQNDDNFYVYLCLIIVAATFLSTVCFYLIAKGYSAWWGLLALLLSLIGLYVVMKLPDRYKELET